MNEHTHALGQDAPTETAEVALRVVSSHAAELQLRRRYFCITSLYPETEHEIFDLTENLAGRKQAIEQISAEIKTAVRVSLTYHTLDLSFGVQT